MKLILKIVFIFAVLLVALVILDRMKKPEEAVTPLAPEVNNGAMD